MFYYNNYKSTFNQNDNVYFRFNFFYNKYCQPNRLQFSVLCLSYQTPLDISRLPRHKLNNVETFIVYFHSRMRRLTNILVYTRLCRIPRSAYCVDSPLQTNFTWCKMLRKNFRNIIYLHRIAIVFFLVEDDLIHNSHVETQFSLQNYVKFAANDKTLSFVFSFHHNVSRNQCFKQETESFAAFFT